MKTLRAARTSHQTAVLYDISWETYERLLADHQDQTAPRLTFDRGTLEVMSPSVIHERLNRLLALIVSVVAEELLIEIDDLGSATFKREDLQRGFEPDSCFYVQSLDRIRGKMSIDLSVDPPPDLIIEIDVTNSSLNKLPLYSQMGIPEVWRFDGTKLEIFLIVEQRYLVSRTSLAFPSLDSDWISLLLQQSRTMKRSEWIRTIRKSIPRKEAGEYRS